jgi:hypothetical protein
MSDPDRRPPISLDELDRALQNLSATMELPAMPDLTSGVLAGIAAGEPRKLWIFPRGRLLAVAAAILIALAAALTLSSGFRSTVADLLHVGGISISFSDEPAPTVAPPSGPLGASLLLGAPIALADAQTMLDFPISPLPEIHGEPDEIFLRQIPDQGPIVSLIYYPSDLLPNTAETGVGVLLMEFRAGAEPGRIAKRIDGEIDWLRGLGDSEAVWIEGTHQLTLISDPSASCCEERRAAGSVLIWTKDGVTYRLESSLSKDEAIAIAQQITP